jgi:hypothetical protein
MPFSAVSRSAGRVLVVLWHSPPGSLYPEGSQLQGWRAMLTAAHAFSDAAFEAPPMMAAHGRIQVKEILMTTPSGHTSAIRAKKVIGTTVNTAGEKIGPVEDIVLTRPRTNHFAVVGFGGFLGMNGSSPGAVVGARLRGERRCLRGAFHQGAAPRRG